jgi:hypothetical protein
VEQGHLWEYKPRKEQYRRKNENTPRNLHLGGLHGGTKKGRTSADPVVGAMMSARRNPLAIKVPD